MAGYNLYHKQTQPYTDLSSFNYATSGTFEQPHSLKKENKSFAKKDNQYFLTINVIVKKCYDNLACIFSCHH